MPDHVDALITELDAAECWPLDRELWARHQVQQRRAFRFGDREVLRAMARWDRHAAGVDRDYLVDPLAKLIAKAYADFFFAEDPVFTLTNTADQALLDEVVEANKLPAGLHRAARMVVGDGEGWWKLHVNREIVQAPLIGWHSRLSVVPHFYGEHLLAAGFVTEVARETEELEQGEIGTVVWRHVEVHGKARVVNVLYRGSPDELGQRVALTTRKETESIQEEWSHGLDMLAGRVVNDLEEDASLGVSDYDQVRDELLAVNEAITISAENARLTGKDRIFTTGRFRQSDGTFDTSLDVFEVNQDDTTLGEGDKVPIVAVEKTYDAEPLWLHIQKLVSLVLSRVGLVPQFVGQEVDGQAESGTAIRLRFMPTTNAAKGKGREWDGSVPLQLDLALRVMALPIEQGGFGRSYSSAGSERPSVERGDVLPVDEGETIVDNSTAVTARIRSRKTAIKAQHPDWSDDQVDEELAAIGEDAKASPAAPLFGG